MLTDVFIHKRVVPSLPIPYYYLLTIPLQWGYDRALMKTQHLGNPVKGDS